MPADMAAAHAANGREPLAPPDDREVPQDGRAREQAEKAAENTEAPKYRKYSQAEKGKGIAEDSAAPAGTRKKRSGIGETSGTAHDKPAPVERPGQALKGAEPASKGPGEESPEALRASSLSRDDGSDASLKHYAAKAPSDEWNETMSLRDYIGHLPGKSGGSSSSDSGSDVLAAAGYNMDQILAKNGRLAEMEARFFTPKRDPKFERTVSGSPGYQRDFDPDKYQGPRGPGEYWLGKESPYGSLPPDLKLKWEDNPIYMPKHKLEERYDRLKHEHAGMAAENARLQGQVRDMEGRVEELKAEVKSAERGQLKIGALGAVAGLAVGAVGGLALGGGSDSDSAAQPQTPPAV